MAPSASSATTTTLGPCTRILRAALFGSDSSVSESEPTCSPRVFCSTSRLGSSARSWVSAPGFRANENVRSPVGSSATNASVVK